MKTGGISPSKRTVWLAGVTLVVAILAGCSKHAHEEHAAHHAHSAPHGGTLVELGEHQFNLEFVRDAAAGSLTAYVLDGHAEHFVRLPLPGFSVVTTVDGRRELLALAAVGNPVTGEMIGDTSEFTAMADWLKTTAEFEGEIEAIEIRGVTFAGVRFRFPQGGAE